MSHRPVTHRQTIPISEFPLRKARGGLSYATEITSVAYPLLIKQTLIAE